MSAADIAKAKIEDLTTLDPKELDKLLKSVMGAEQAPTSAGQTPGTSQWTALRDQLGPPFDSEQVSMPQMRQLRKDPMIAFGLHYRKVPIARAEIYCEARDKNGVNPQVAAFTHAVISKIWARYVFQRTLAFDFGFQAMVKRWVFDIPPGVFLDTTEADQTKQVKPIWDEGNIVPKIYKAPVAVRPELVTPTFDDNSGEFTGFTYTIPSTTAAATATGSAARRSRKSAQAAQIVDVYHALWATNQKDNEHGSIYGYPLTGFARDYWWAYKFLYGMNNRAYERLAIPPVVARHPEGSTVIDSTGATRPNWEIALEMAERLRSNAVAAVPSTMASAGIGESSNTNYAWDFKFLETPTDALGAFDTRFNYLNVMKLRSIWVPELAFVANQSGGNSGGNIAEQMAEVFTESQALFMDEILDEINQYMIPQLLWLNFPEFVNNGGKAFMKSRGFKSSDLELAKQLIQLFGQQDPTSFDDVDLPELLRRLGLPMKDPAQLQAEREALATQQEQAAAVVPAVPGVTTQITNPTVAPGSTNGGSVPEPAAAGAVAGFEDVGGTYVYYAPREQIEISTELADVDEFLSGLPSSKHYQDKNIRALSVQLRRAWQAHWRRMYPDLANYMDKLTLEFEDDFIVTPDGYYALADSPKKIVGDAITYVSKTRAAKAASKIIKGFQPSSKTLDTLRKNSATIIKKMVKRAAFLEAKDGNYSSTVDEDTIDSFVDEQVARLVKLTHQTFDDEVRNHLVNEIREGKSTSEIADGLVARFQGQPSTKADRIARSETRDAVNAATLMTGTSAGLRYTRATDGEEFDEECKDRNGKLFTIREAWKELRKEHPYGTLGFVLMPRANFSIKWVESMPEEHEQHDAYFDDDTSTAVLVFGTPDEEVDLFFDALYEKFSKESRNGNGHVKV